MNCTEARSTIDRLSPADELQDLLNEHLRDCELCRHYYTDALLLQELHALEVSGPSPAFIDQALKRTISGETSAPANRTWRTWKVPVAIAASLLLTLAGVFALRDPPTMTGGLPLAENHTPAIPNGVKSQYFREEVKIIIYSKEDRDLAELSIDLAENLELEGFAGQQHLAWNTNLVKGANLLVLPVLVHEDGGEIRVSSQFGDARHEVSVKIARQNTPPQSGAVQQTGTLLSGELTG